jgi:hypothetical protein
MKTGIIIASILTIIIVIDFVIKTKARTYSLIQFLLLVLATLVLIAYAIIEIINKSSYFIFLIFIMVGLIGSIKQYLSLNKQNFI